MRTLAAVLLALVLSGCPTQSAYTGPPVSQLYYPTGVVHVARPGSAEGALFVANANFDKRYATGSLVGFSLDGLGLPAFGAPVAEGAVPPQLTDLKVSSEAVVQVTSFAGEMAGLETRADAVRLFVPSRSEGNNFHAVEATFGADGQPTLRCVLPPDADPSTSATDCAGSAPSLTAFEFDDDGIPRAPAPFGVAVRARACTSAADCGAGRTCDVGTCRAASGDVFGDVWVTHLTQADTPLASGQNARGYLVRFDSDRLAADEANFLNLGFGGSNSVVAGRRWAYVSGRYNSSTGSADLVRLVEQQRADDGQGGTSLLNVALSTGIELNYRVAEARGVAVSSDEKRLYLVGRGPDSLLVVSIDDAAADAPILNVVRAIQLPNGANEIRTIPRPGRSDLVAITCSGGGVLVLYDDDVGDVVAQVQGVGLQPFGLAVSPRAPGARLFVTNFSDGRVAVIDIPDLDRPQDARVVAWLGEQQLCLTRGSNTPGCSGGAP